MKETEGAHTRAERRDAAENRQRILQAALRLFEQQGVEQVSMNQIATEAQIGPGTLYRRYRNKSELCLDLIRDSIDLLFDDIEAYLQQSQLEAPRQRLKGILRYFVRFREQKAQLLTGVEESPSSNRQRPRAQSPLYDDLQQLVVNLFEEMAAHEQVPSNSVFRADLLLVALSSESYLFQREVRGYSPEEIVELLVATFFPQQDLPSR